MKTTELGYPLQKCACLCGSSARMPLIWRERHGLELWPSICMRCGHVYLPTRISGPNLIDFYSTSNYRALYGAGDKLKSEDAKRSRIEAAKRNLLPLVKAEREQKRAADFKIIEWGCGAGWNLVPLRDAGFDVSGYDYDRNYVDYGIMEFKLQLNAIIDETIYRIKGQADVLIINHVLEHIEDPFYTLKSLSDVLKPGGVVIIGMPFLENISTWGLKSFFHIAHVHYFGIAHFCRIVERFNWVVKKVDVAKGIVVIARNSVIASDKFSDQLTSFPRARLKNASTLLMQQVKELPLLIKGLLRPLYHWIRSVKLGT